MDKNHKVKKVSISIVLLTILLIVQIGVSVFFIIAIIEKQNDWNGSYCTKAVDCTKCENNEKECHYIYEDDNGNKFTSEDTILCDCE